MYYEDLIEKKDHDLRTKSKNLAIITKKMQELNKTVEELRANRKSSGSLNSRNDMTSSYRSDSKQR
jgi:hypothetical protein